MNLKETLGDLYTPEVEEKLKGTKFVDLTSGEYVSVDKYNALDTKNKTLEAEKVALGKELTKTNENQLTEVQKMEKLIKETAQVKSELTRDRNKLEAEKILAKAGLNEEDYSEYINKIVSEDVDTTKSIAESIVNTINKQKALAEQRVKEELESRETLPPAGMPSKEMTLEEFNKLSYEELVKLSQEQPEVYKKFI